LYNVASVAVFPCLRIGDEGVWISCPCAGPM
jgi:hypothetical protein